MRGRPDELDGLRNYVDASSSRSDAPSVAEETKMTENDVVNVRTRQTSRPNTPEIKPPELAGRWRRVGIGDGDGYYAPSNALIEALGMASRRSPLDGSRA